MNYPRLFTEGRIGPLRLRNRIVMAPLSSNFASATGEITEWMLDFYARRARGGVGLVIVESSNVDYPDGKSGSTQLRLDDKAFLPGLSCLAEAVHLYGAAISIQLNHAGAISDAGERLAPSCVEAGMFPRNVRELTRDEIEEIVNKFAVAAGIVKMAGFDAVELHGAHGYLLSQFMSPFTNKRTDMYGGTLENRMRLPVAIVKAIRAAVGPGTAITFRLNGDEFIAGGAGIDEVVLRARMLEGAGVDGIHVSGGIPWTWESRARMVEPMSFPQGWKVYLARRIREAVNIPVIAVGTIREPQVAEGILSEEAADFVALGRGLIADPDWPRKAREGQGEAIRRCISCFECLKRRSFEFLPIRCTVNPGVGQFYAPGPANKMGGKPKRALVAGGGPAGMRAAIALAARGYEVALYEQATELGGQLNVACIPPGKDKIGWLRDDLVYELKQSRVRVELGRKVDKEVLDVEKPDVLIAACGSEEIRPFFTSSPEIESATARKVLQAPPSGRQVVVVGGGSVGCETALFLSKSNAVTVVEMLEACAPDLDVVTRVDLLGSLKEAGVTIINGATVKGICSQGVEVEKNGSTMVIPADYVVSAVGARPRGLGDLRDYVTEYYVIGDGRKPGKIFRATQDAFAVACLV